MKTAYKIENPVLILLKYPTVLIHGNTTRASYLRSNDMRRHVKRNFPLAALHY